MTKDKLASWLACLWLIISMSPFFIWGRYENYFTLFAAVGVIYATALVGIRFSQEKLKRWGWLLLLLTMLIAWTVYDKTFLFIFRKILIWFPFYLIILWPEKNIRNTYFLFRKIIVFFAIGSSIVSILGAVGLLSFFPSFTMQGRSELHQRLDMYYRIYGCFVTLGGVDSLIPRACGFLQEPGHFSIVLGFVYLIDRFLDQKRNLWIILCGLLTFSMNFVIIALVSELLQVNNVGRSFGFIFKMLLIVIVLGVVYALLPGTLQHSVSYLFFERNFSEVFDLFQETGSVTEALNARINQTGELEYASLTSKELLVGKRFFDSDMILSDYRGIIYTFGYIGLTLSILTLLSIVFNAKTWRFRLALSVAFVLVFLHRSWMFNSPYLYFLSFLGITILLDDSVNDNVDDSVGLTNGSIVDARDVTVKNEEYTQWV